MDTKLELTPRGRIALVLLHLTAGAAFLTGDDNARLAASLIAAPLLIDVAVKLLRRPRVELTVAQRRTHARAAFLEALSIRNLARHPLRDLLLREPATHIHSAGGIHIPYLAGGTAQPCRVAARSNRRGIAAERRFSARTEFPLGFLAWRLEQSVRARLVTEPARVPLSPYAASAWTEARPRFDEGRRDQASEFHSLREYRYGEDARLVQARRSAALGVLVRRVLRGGPIADATLVLDLRRPRGMPTQYGRRDLDPHLGRAAAAVDLALAQGTQLRCLAIDAEQTHSFAVTDRNSSTAFLDYLAAARSCPFRTLHDDERALLPDDGLTLWVPAGGFVDEGAQRRTDVLVLREEAS
ncbi:MAG: DUF58 domain-containing protein [Planctomycetes bacterium]|nr:DUF58 domain-containing protein [Planctomycetota bacterium]